MANEKSYKSRSGDSKNVILIIGLLLLVILVAGGILVLVILQKGAPTPEVIIPPPVINKTPVANTTAFVCDDSCYYENATAHQDYTLCISILDNNLRQQCYAALSNVSLDACKLVLNKSISTSCITAFAKASADLTLCNLLDNSSSCQLAVDPCITDPNRPLCEAFYFKNISKCNGNADCLLNYSITKQDSSACLQISNEVVAAACTSAITAQDNCGALGQDSKVDYCHELYAIYGKNFNLCSLVTLGSTYRVDCYSSFAAQFGNYSVCNQGGLQFNDLWACYTSYALSSGDLSACTAIHYLASTSKFQCVFQYAKKYGDAAACEVLDSAQRLTCYQGAILYSLNTLNYKYCAGVLDSDWSTQCYLQAAKAQNDVSICNYISVNLSRIACIDSYISNKTKSN